MKSPRPSLRLEAREKALKDQMKATEDELSVKTLGLHETERNLSDKQSAMARLSSDLGDRTAMSESQRVELIAFRTQIDALKMRIGDYEQDIKKVEDRLEKERAESTQATQDLGDERGKVENLGKRVGQLEQQLVAQSTEAEFLGKRAAELDSRVADQGRVLVEREYECDRLKSELEITRQTIGDLRQEIGDTGGRHRETIQSFTSEKELMQKEIRPRHCGAHEAARRSRRHEARGRGKLGRRTGRECAAARAHQRRCRRSRKTRGHAGRPEFADRGDPCIRIVDARRCEWRSMAGAGRATPLDAENDAKGGLADRMRALQSRASRLSTSS